MFLIENHTVKDLRCEVGQGNSECEVISYFLKKDQVKLYSIYSINL